MKKLLYVLFGLIFISCADAQIRKESAKFQYTNTVAFSGRVIFGKNLITNGYMNDSNLVVSASILSKDGIALPAGTDEERPEISNSSNPILRYNSTQNAFEYNYGSTNWNPIASLQVTNIPSQPRSGYWREGIGVRESGSPIANTVNYYEYVITSVFPYTTRTIIPIEWGGTSKFQSVLLEPFRLHSVFNTSLSLCSAVSGTNLINNGYPEDVFLTGYYTDGISITSYIPANATSVSVALRSNSLVAASIKGVEDITNQYPVTQLSSARFITSSNGWTSSWSYPDIAYYTTYGYTNDPLTFPCSGQTEPSRFTRTVVQNPDFFLKDVDLTGASIQNSALLNFRGGALITRKHYICAKHWPIEIGHWVLFMDRNGNVYSNQVAKSTNDNSTVNSDVTLLEFSSEVNSNITPFAVVSYTNSQKTFAVDYYGRRIKNSQFNTTSNYSSYTPISNLDCTKFLGKFVRRSQMEMWIVGWWSYDIGSFYAPYTVSGVDKDSGSSCYLIISNRAYLIGGLTSYWDSSSINPTELQNYIYEWGSTNKIEELDISSFITNTLLSEPIITQIPTNIYIPSNSSLPSNSFIAAMRKGVEDITNQYPVTQLSSARFITSSNGWTSSWSYPDINYYTAYGYTNDPLTFPCSGQTEPSRFTRTVVQNPDFFLKDVDLTGAPIQNSALLNFRGGALITRKHVLSSAHWPFENGHWVSFMDRNGNVYSNQIVKTYPATAGGSGVAIHEFSSEVNSNITPFAVVSYTNSRSMYSIVSWGQAYNSGQLDTSILAKFVRRSQMEMWIAGFLAWDIVTFYGTIFGVDKDSGSSSYIILNNRAYLTGLMETVGTASKLDTLALQNKIYEWGSTNKIEELDITQWLN